MASDYLSEKVVYGGEITTRGEMLADLKRLSTAWTDDPIRQRMMVDRYMQGAEISAENRNLSQAW